MYSPGIVDTEIKKVCGSNEEKIAEVSLFVRIWL